MRACSAIELFGEHRVSCPVSEEVETTTLHLPIYPTLKDETIDKISNIVKDTVKK